MSNKLNINKIITEDDWKNIKRELNLYRDKKDWWNFFWIAMSVRIIFPRKNKELNLNEEVWQGIKNQLDSYLELENKFKGLKSPRHELDLYRSRGTWHSFCPQAMALKFIFPERTNKILNDQIWQNIKQTIEWFRKENNWGDFAAFSMDIKVLFPDKIDKLNFNDRDWNGMKNLLESYREENNWWNFPSLATKMKVIFPDKDKELNLDDQVWQGIKKELELYRQQKKWVEFVVQTSKIKILTTPSKIISLVISSHLIQKILQKII